MLLVYFYKTIKKIWNKIFTPIEKVYVYILFKCNNISFKSFKTNGVPQLIIAIGGTCTIGKNFIMNNGKKGNPIGGNQRCTIFVDKKAKIKIGDNVGISQTALIAIENITIGNNVKIGGGSYLYTSDFHSLDPNIRNSQEDFIKRKNAPIVLEDNVFIGAHSIILKGVHIGKNSIIGAGSVVTKSIPENQIWAGNPARFIKRIE